MTNKNIVMDKVNKVGVVASVVAGISSVIISVDHCYETFKECKCDDEPKKKRKIFGKKDEAK